MSAVKPLQQATHDAIDEVSDKVNEARKQAAPVVSRLTSQATEFTHRAVDAVKDGTERARKKAQRVSANTVTYIKDEPVKAVLIAAAVGATVALVTRMLSSRNSD